MNAADATAQKKHKPRGVPCLGRMLLAGEAAALGLNPARKWYACTTGEHPAHCGCKGNRKTV